MLPIFVGRTPPRLDRHGVSTQRGRVRDACDRGLAGVESALRVSMKLMSHDDLTATTVDALWRVLATRRDHRHFHPTPVPREVIERLLAVFSVAPSVGLSQPWH